MSRPTSPAQAAAPMRTSAAAAAMKRSGKTFWFAKLFLPRETASDAAILYHLCRVLDDIADGTAAPDSQRHPNLDAPTRLQQIRFDLQRGSSDEPIVAEFLKLAQRRSIHLAAINHLIDALLADATQDIQIADSDALIRYCYGVAGTVGLMMSAILGASREATTQAIDLGIAMQLTNIARDVLEDARNNRRYLPATWLVAINDAPSPQQIATDPDHREIVADAIRRLLDLADFYYSAAVPGFAAIPSRSRHAIRIAAAVYREIGVTLRTDNCHWWQGRTVVPTRRKLALAASVFIGRSTVERLRPLADPVPLHRMIADLPGVR